MEKFSHVLGQMLRVSWSFKLEEKKSLSIKVPLLFLNSLQARFSKGLKNLNGKFLMNHIDLTRFHVFLLF